MDAIEAILTRNSVAQLTEPGPTAQQLDNILSAGLRANDHRRLRPWKFLLIEGQARNQLGQIMVNIQLQDNADLTEQQQQSLAAKALRAPLIIAVIATVSADEKVPEIEQILSAGGAAQLMMLAAHAQGVGAVWRTGDIAYDSRMKSALGLAQQDQIVGFLYMGTAKSVKPLAPMNTEDYVVRWQG